MYSWMRFAWWLTATKPRKLKMTRLKILTYPRMRSFCRLRTALGGTLHHLADFRAVQTKIRLRKKFVSQSVGAGPATQLLRFFQALTQ
jgi:hypothetical protein